MSKLNDNNTLSDPYKDYLIYEEFNAYKELLSTYKAKPDEKSGDVLKNAHRNLVRNALQEMILLCTSGMVIEEKDRDYMTDLFLREVFNKEIYLKVSQAVMRCPTLQEFESILLDISQKCDEIYKHYVESYSMPSESGIYNTLLGRYWNDTISAFEKTSNEFMDYLFVS